MKRNILLITTCLLVPLVMYVLWNVPIYFSMFEFFLIIFVLDFSRTSKVENKYKILLLVLVILVGFGAEVLFDHKLQFMIIDVAIIVLAINEFLGILHKNN